MESITINKHKQKSLLSSSLVLLFLLFVVLYLSYLLMLPKIPNAKVTFFDVGQGDSALISTPNNQYILIDGGPDSSVISKLGSEIPPYHRTLDAIILTHPHADHLVGLNSVLKKYKVNNIYLTGVLHTTPEYFEFLELIKEKSIPLKIVGRGDSLDLGDESRIEFLYPEKIFAGERVENLNDTSLVANFYYGKKNIIFMGDLEKDSQAVIIKNDQKVSADVIKVAHHGSFDSFNKDFLNLVKAKYAVISVGKDNKFGHPSQAVMSYFNGTNIYRTDQDGDVVFYLSKSDLWPQKP